MLNFHPTHRRLKTPSGWVVRVFRHEGRILAYRECQRKEASWDELFLSYESKRLRRDTKRIVAGLLAEVIDPTTPLADPRPDTSLLSPQEKRDEQRFNLLWWWDIRQMEQELRARRLSGGVDTSQWD